MKWSAAATGYTRRTKESYEERVAAFVAWCTEHGATLPSEVTDGLVDQWTADRSVDVSRRTINRDLRPVRTCLRWCAERSLCEPVAAVERKGMREPKPLRHKLLPDPVETARALTAVPSQGYRDALVIYYATGLRYEELLRVGVGDVHDGHVYVQPEERRDDGWRLDAWESSLTAFAGGHGVQRVTLFARLERGWPATIAATVGVDPSPPWTDTEREAVEAARSRGISRPCVLHRLRAGWSLDAATTTPSKRSPK